MKNSKNQQGFGLISIFAIIICLAIVGMVGWYVMRKNSTLPKADVTSDRSPTQQAPTAERSKAKEKVIPADWQWFTSKNGGVKFAYPKVWGALAEIEKAEAPGYYDDTNNFMRPVVITSKSDFLIQVRQGFYDPTWFTWNSTTNGLQSAKDEQAPESPSMNYDNPISLGEPKAVEPRILSGASKHPIYYVLGKGAMNCGARHYFFDIKDKVVHISATLCERDGEWKPQAGQQYTDVVEEPFKEFYDYTEK